MTHKNKLHGLHKPLVFPDESNRQLNRFKVSTTASGLALTIGTIISGLHEEDMSAWAPEEQSKSRLLNDTHHIRKRTCLHNDDFCSMGCNRNWHVHVDYEDNLFQKSKCEIRAKRQTATA